MQDFKLPLTLQEQVQSQGQQRGILVFLTVSGHQQKKQYNQKIGGIEISREDIAQETTNRCS